MKRTPHKTTPKVRDGRVQKKNRHDLTSGYWNTPQRFPLFNKEKPGSGYKHFLRKDHVTRFIQLVPEWDELSKDLNAVLLAEGGWAYGWWHEGVVGICAWPRDGSITISNGLFEQEEEILERLCVSWAKEENHYVCQFSDSQVRAFQLLRVFLHELGHHHDRKTDHGEKYADEYARKYESIIWQHYINEFEL